MKKQGIFYLAVSVILCCSAKVYAYPYGYTRLYRSDTQTIVDIVYDTHVATKKLSHYDMDVLLCDDIKQGLYASERALLESLERLNQAHPHDVTVVWETSPGASYRDVQLLTYPQRLIANRLRNIHFVHSDTWRCDYPKSILSLFDGTSLRHRVNSQAIIDQSGQHAWEQYCALMDQTTRKVTALYSPLKNSVRNSCRGDSTYMAHFCQNYTFAELADLEMLSHVLASPHHRIIVYAGGFHAINIANFLQASAGYQLVRSVVDVYQPEISPYELKGITQDYGPRLSGRPERAFSKPLLKKHEGTSKPSIACPDNPQTLSDVVELSDNPKLVIGALALVGSWSLPTTRRSIILVLTCRSLQSTVF